MSIKIGDKVRFLNDIGGGTVSAFCGKDQVIVDQEDGFGFPIYIRECVIIESSGTSQVPTPIEIKPKAWYSNTKKAEPKEKSINSTDVDHLNIQIAYFPSDQNATQPASYETYLINDSNFSLYFTYLSRHNSDYICRHNSIVAPNTQIFIESINTVSLNDLEHICIQVIAFKEKQPFSLKRSISADINLDTVKFYKRSSFVKTKYFQHDALIVPIVKNNITEQAKYINSTELQKAMTDKKQMDQSIKQPINTKKEVKSDIIETDLHIHELLDSTAGMSSSDIFKHQVEAFNRIMKKHEKVRNQKLVFIHGKGDGILRKALEKELRTHYKQHTHQDASFCEYGFGAIMVIIR